MISPDDINFNNLSIDWFTLEYNETNLEKKYRNSRMRKNDKDSKFYFFVFFLFSLALFFNNIFTDDEETRPAISLVVLLVIITIAIFFHNPKRIYVYYWSPLILLIAILCSKIVSDHLTIKPHVLYMVAFLPMFFSWNYSMNFLLIMIMNTILFASTIYL